AMEPSPAPTEGVAYASTPEGAPSMIASTPPPAKRLPISTGAVPPPGAPFPTDVPRTPGERSGKSGPRTPGGKGGKVGLGRRPAGPGRPAGAAGPPPAGFAAAGGNPAAPRVHWIASVRARTGPATAANGRRARVNPAGGVDVLETPRHPGTQPLKAPGGLSPRVHLRPPDGRRPGRPGLGLCLPTP